MIGTRVTRLIYKTRCLRGRAILSLKLIVFMSRFLNNFEPNFNNACIQAARVKWSKKGCSHILEAN